MQLVEIADNDALGRRVVGFDDLAHFLVDRMRGLIRHTLGLRHRLAEKDFAIVIGIRERRSEEHTSELQSLMRISYAVFCLKKKNNTTQQIHATITVLTHTIH